MTAFLGGVCKVHFLRSSITFQLLYIVHLSRISSREHVSGFWVEPSLKAVTSVDALGLLDLTQLDVLGLSQASSGPGGVPLPHTCLQVLTVSLCWLSVPWRSPPLSPAPVLRRLLSTRPSASVHSASWRGLGLLGGRAARPGPLPAAEASSPRRASLWACHRQPEATFPTRGPGGQWAPRASCSSRGWHGFSRWRRPCVVLTAPPPPGEACSWPPAPRPDPSHSLPGPALSQWPPAWPLASHLAPGQTLFHTVAGTVF